MGRRERGERRDRADRYRWIAPVAEASLRLVPRVPVRALEALGSLGWRLAYAGERRRRRRMQAGLAAALGERFPTPTARRRVLRECTRQLHRSVLDGALAVLYPRERERVREIPIEGREHLDKALARGRGVLVVSAHLGAFTLVPIRLAALHPVSLVANHPDDPRMAAWLDDCRERAGFGSVPVRPRHAAARASLQALREGRILVIVADEFKAGGVPVSFLGHPASAPRGPATLALRTGAPLLPVFAPRDAQGRPRLVVGPEIELSRSDDPVADVAAVTGRICALIEQEVRRRPEQWNWANFRQRARRGAAKFSARRGEGAAEIPSA